MIAPPAVRVVAGALGIAAVQATILSIMGQPPLCECGTVRLFAANVLSPENSQQLADWYTFSHVIHGFLFYALLSWLFPQTGIGVRLLIALGIEAGWEIVENTPMVIEHYRAQALAAGYAGDSVLNSLADTAAALLGFLAARRLPILLVVALAIGMEVFTSVMIHDGLTLNVLQLVYPHPIPFLSAWQAGG
jgi:hypothetical protein